MPASRDTVTGLILAGGRASRMGGQDKGLLRLQGQPFAVLLAQQLKNQVDEIQINANRNIGEYRKFGFPVVRDDLGGYQGPLAGMLAGLRASGTRWLLTVPCDGPLLSPDYARRMMSAAREQGNPLSVASDGDRLQPVYALIHRSLEASLAAFLASGDRKIDRWYANHSYSRVSFADSVEMFTNVNSPGDLEALTAPGPDSPG